MVGEYRLYPLIGEAKLTYGTDYVSFTGDLGFSGWLPTQEVMERHLAHESHLLSRFRLSVINLEFMLPGVSGRTLDRQIDHSVIDTLNKSGYSVVARANNHALDFGLEGIRYNAAQLEKAGLAMIGTRDSPVYEWETGGHQVAIYALTDNTDQEDQEHLILRINEVDLAFIRQRTSHAHFRIAFVHLGSMSFFPSPHERKQVCRLLDAGADLVVCTGSHFIKGCVTERGKPVAYGIGNHLLSHIDSDTEPIGMHLVAGFRSGELVQLFVIPFRNLILEGNTGPLDEAAFASFQKTLLERSTGNVTNYYSDKGSLDRLKKSLRRFRFSSLRQIKPRHFVYIARIVFHHYLITVTTGCIRWFRVEFSILSRISQLWKRVRSVLKQR